MYYLDTETCGLHGMPVLLQYAEDEGSIQLWEFWREPILESLSLIEKFANGEVCGFNLAFDWFMLTKFYNTGVLFMEKYGPEALPEDYIDEFAVLEEKARDGFCLKPRAACDLMLLARRGKYQSTMDRDDIRVKRVPTALAYALAQELEKKIVFKDIYFANYKTKMERWRVFDIEDEETGEILPDFKDVVCKFNPSTRLKALAVDALNVKQEDVLSLYDVGVSASYTPEEVGWAPFALAIGTPADWKGAWPQVIRMHIAHWAFNDLARQYGTNDIIYTRGLWHHFGKPQPGDEDSNLACLVATVRWKGYAIDVEGIKQLREEAIADSKKTTTAPEKVKIYLKEVMSKDEAIVLQDGTGKIILEKITQWTTDDGKIHPAAQRAKAILDARKAKYNIGIYDKLLQAGRFHASFKVSGTLSSRMSGTDGLNPQGINHMSKVRSKFLLSWAGEDTGGGDFSGFEVSLAAAVYNDEKLTAALKSGKKFAGIVGEVFFPDMTYEQILASEGQEEDFYDKGKRGGFAYLYGGNENTLNERIGIPIDLGKKAIEDFQRTYLGVAESRKKIHKMFCSMVQPGGIGSQVVWNEPADYIETKLGDRRYFTLENMVCKTLFQLANRPPVAWSQIKLKVVRRDRLQTACGALQSALYGAAFQIQAANLRAAANHEIQSLGARITKQVQLVVWSFQPVGVHKWVVRPFNNHDEINAPMDPSIGEAVERAVQEKISTYLPMVPLLKMKWNRKLKSWKGKD